MARHVIYVPGLGDHHYKGQAELISTWRLWGVRPHMERMVWNQGRDFEPKLHRLLEKIDELYDAGHSVSLVGASAGAGAVMNAFAARRSKITGVVLIAGWVNYPESIGNGYRQTNPSFVDSASRVPASLATLEAADRARIQSRVGVVDPIVPRKHSQIPGSQMITVPSMGHGVTIAAQLVFGAPFFLRWLKMLES